MGGHGGDHEAARKGLGGLLYSLVCRGYCFAQYGAVLGSPRRVVIDAP